MFNKKKALDISRAFILAEQNKRIIQLLETSLGRSAQNILGADKHL